MPERGHLRAGGPNARWTAAFRDGQPLSHPPGASLVTQGQPCPGIVLLESGRLRVSLQGPDGRELALYRVLPGELCALSIVSVLRSIPFPAHVTAETPVRGWLLERGRFLALLGHNAELQRLVSERLAERLGEALVLLEQFVFGGLEGRILHALRRHAGTAPRAGPIPITHEALARETGSAREAVSRVLKSLERSGRVRLLRGHIELLERTSAPGGWPLPARRDAG